MSMSRKEKALQFADEGYGCNIQITGRHVQVTDAMKSYALDKTSKIERFSDRIIDINIILDIQKLEHKAEIIIKVGPTIIAGTGTSDDMYISIDKAVAKIETQLKKYKSRLHDHHARVIPSVEMNVNVIRVPTPEEELEDIEYVEEKFPHEIVKKETLPLKMLRLDEAVMKMELSGDPFLLFKCEEDQKLKVIYRRDDGDFGVIEPQCS